ncbi:MAG TPA: hypothetical protein VLC95_05305, partial [Anaerolineae bacterium]|nr:hypothetical protein [Anaerolineae bacterium]
VFFLPAFLLTAVWISAGIDYAMTLLRPRGPSLALRRLQAVCFVLVVGGALAQSLAIAVQHYPDLDLSRRWIVHDWGVYVLSEPLPEDTTIVGLLGEATLLRTLQETAGWRPDAEIVAADPDAARRDAIDAAYAAERTVFVTRPAPGLANDYALSAVTGVIHVLGEPETLIRLGAPAFEIPDVPRRVDLSPMPGLHLLGYGVRQHTAHWQSWARLRLWWRAPDGFDLSFKVSARLLDPAGMPVAAGDAEPVSGLYPAPAWRPGEVVADAYEIPLPAGLPAGQYVPLVIVYDPATGAEWGRVLLDPVTLEAVPARPPRRSLEAEVAYTVYARFREIELLGFTPPDPEPAYTGGAELSTMLLWQAGDEPVTGEWRVELLLEGNGRTVTLEEVPVGGAYPVARWQSEQVVRQWLAPTMPPELPAGEYALKLRVTRDGRPVPWGRGWLPLGSDLILGNLRQR